MNHTGINMNKRLASIILALIVLIVPVKMDARAGEQTGDTQKKLLKIMPWAANLSIFGVFISLFP